MTTKTNRQAKARKAYQERRLRARIKALNNMPGKPDVRPSLADWQPLVKLTPDKTREWDALMKAGAPFPIGKTERFANNKWRAALNEGTGQFPLLHLWIIPQDNMSEPTWAECQAIKNQLLGADQEMVQLYPSERRMVNAVNVYHLWGMKGQPIPFGMDLATMFPDAVGPESRKQVGHQ
jgi:hypothetical protein